LGRAVEQVAVFHVLRQGVHDLAIETALDEDKRAGAALLDGHVVDGRGSRNPVTDPYGRAKLELAAGPHAARQRHRRKEAAALGVPIGADFRLSMHRQKIQPVPKVRQGGAGLYGRRRVVQRGGQRDDWCRVDGVLDGLAASDPGAKFFSLQAHSLVSVCGSCF